MSQHSRGSSHWLLQWMHIKREAFTKELANLINISGLDVKITSKDWWRPDCTLDGGVYPEEVTTQGIHKSILYPEHKKEISEWWIKHPKGANTPNWDFISGANIEGVQGLIIIEAKSHKNEIKKDGKILQNGSSDKSEENHIHIRQAIEEAKNRLSKNYKGINISIDNHYQLSNRIAYAWKFATLGIPIMLIYLGFINDMEMEDIGEPFKSADEWNEFMKGCIKDIFPVELLEKKINCGKSYFYFLLRSIEIKDIKNRLV